MFSKPEMVRKELYCTRSIISKFAVHRHFKVNLQSQKTTHCKIHRVCIQSAYRPRGLGILTPARSSRQGLGQVGCETEWVDSW